MSNSLLYATSVLIWGSTWLMMTFQLGEVAPLLSIAYRFCIASLLLLGFCLLARKRLRFSVLDHGLMLLQGCCLFGVNYWLLYIAAGQLTSGLVAVVFSTMAFMNILNGRLLLGAPVRPQVVLGALFGLAGLVLLFWPEFAASDMQQQTINAILIALAGTYISSFGNILAASNQRRQLPVLQSNAFGMGYAAVLMLAIALINGVELRFEVSFGYIGSLLYLAVLGSIVAFSCYLTLVGRIGADRAAYAGLLFPVIALQLSAWFEDYQWSALSLAGLGLVLLGNLLVMARLSLLLKLRDRLAGAVARPFGSEEAAA